MTSTGADVSTATSLMPSDYEVLAATMSAARDQDGIGVPELTAIAAALLYREARLLDMRQYRAWLELLSEDCVYWLPADPDESDARRLSGVNFDDKRRLTDRITAIETGVLRAQMPPSRTCRMIGNVEAWAGPGGAIEVRSNIAAWEHRRGKTACYVGSQQHELVKGGDGWLIRRKIITLLDCDQPQGNLTFIL